MLLKGIKEAWKGEKYQITSTRNDYVNTLLSFQAYPVGSKCLQSPEQALSQLGACVLKKKKPPKNPTKKKYQHNYFPWAKASQCLLSSTDGEFSTGTWIEEAKGMEGGSGENLDCLRDLFRYLLFWLKVNKCSYLSYPKWGKLTEIFILAALVKFFSLASHVCIASPILADHPKLSAESMETGTYLLCFACLPQGEMTCVLALRVSHPWLLWKPIYPSSTSQSEDFQPLFR